MDIGKDITPFNKEGKRHGYWEEYRSNGTIFYKGYFNNGNEVGYWEDYWYNWKEIRIYI